MSFPSSSFSFLPSVARQLQIHGIIWPLTSYAISSFSPSLCDRPSRFLLFQPLTSCCVTGADAFSVHPPGSSRLLVAIPCLGSAPRTTPSPCFSRLVSAVLSRLSGCLMLRPAKHGLQGRGSLLLCHPKCPCLIHLHTPSCPGLCPVRLGCTVRWEDTVLNPLWLPQGKLLLAVT